MFFLLKNVIVFLLLNKDLLYHATNICWRKISIKNALFYFASKNEGCKQFINARTNHDCVWVLDLFIIIFIIV
jgi:hypothetical protein